MVEELKWGWSVLGKENAHGPFETRIEALTHAKECLSLTVSHSGEYEIEVGRCEPAILDDHMPGPEDVLEWINQHAYDNGFSYEGAFAFKDSEDAFFVAFEELLKKHVQSTGAWQLVETEKVKITVEKAR